MITGRFLLCTILIKLNLRMVELCNDRQQLPKTA